LIFFAIFEWFFPFDAIVRVVCYTLEYPLRFFALEGIHLKKVPVIAMLIFWSFISPMEAQGELIKDRFSIQLAGGLFAPFEGNSGLVVQGGLLYAISPNLALGGELEFREFETTIMGVGGVNVEAFSLHVVGKFFFRPEGISPYVGGGLSTSVNVFDSKKIERENPGVDGVNEIDMGGGVFGILGVLLPLSTHVSFFAELRSRVDFQVIDWEGPKIENLSGMLAVGGIFIPL